jgi:hypothetical protein
MALDPRCTRVLLAGAALVAVAGTAIASAGIASAAQLDGEPSPLVAVVPAVPVDPQPLVAGHEGDVLLRVSVAMPGTHVAKALKPRAKKSRR